MAKKASGKKNTTAVVVAEPKTPSEISAGLARGLSTHYAELCKMARVAFRTSIAFGALLVVAQQKLEQAGLLKTGRGSEGEGLKGWLAKNCPEVNYKTAMKWKLRAELMIKGLGGDKNALYATAGDVAYVCDDGKTIDIPSETLDKRDDIFKCETVAKFEQMMLDLFGDGGKGGGRPKGTGAAKLPGPGADYSSLRRTTPENASRAYATIWTELEKKRHLPQTASVLPVEDAKSILDLMDPVYQALKRRVGEKM